MEAVLASMSGALRIRPLESLDAGRVAALDGACLLSAHWPASAYSMQHDALLQAWVASAAAESEELRGFIAVRCAADEMEILNLAVSPESRRQGIARQLFKEALKHACHRDVKRIYLEVRESNTAAIGFYRAMRFQESGRRGTYYSNPVEDALVLARNVVLPPSPQT